MNEFLEYDSPGHKYYANGIERPSVTTILAESGLINTFGFTEEARARGTLVHELTAKDDQGTCDLRQVKPEFRGYVRAWRKFRRDSHFFPLLIEQRVDDPVNCYAGRFDRVGTFEPLQNFQTMLDIKTNRNGAIGDYVKYQLVAYAHALEPNRIFRRTAVALRPDGSYNTRSWEPLTFMDDRDEWLRMVKQFWANSGQSNEREGVRKVGGKENGK